MSTKKWTSLKKHHQNDGKTAGNAMTARLKEVIITKAQFVINYIERFIIQLIHPNSVRGWVFRTFARKNA